MKVSALEFIPFNYRLKFSFRTSGGDIKERRGFFVKASGGGCEPGIGEAAPLPEFGTETFFQTQDALKEAEYLLCKHSWEYSGPQELTQSLAFLNDYPAARHGIEQALLNLLVNNGKTTLDRLLNVHSNKRIRVNALIDLLSPGEVLLRAKTIIEAGFTTLKLKMGREEFEQDYQTVELIRKSFGNKVSLRLDVNGKWALPQAKENLKKLKHFCPEYIEQPVISREDFFELCRTSPVPLAADEILRSPEDVEEIIRNCKGAVLILKPMMAGGILNSLKVINAAEMGGAQVVLSSAFETSVGRRATVFLASVVAPPTAHGLGTRDYLEGETYSDPFEIQRGIIEINDKADFHKV